MAAPERYRADGPDLVTRSVDDVAYEVGMVLDLRYEDPSVLITRAIPLDAVFLDVDAGLLGATKVEMTLKRLIDLAVSCVSILLAFPLMLAIAVAVKLTSEGPILFRQRRVGQNGASFEMLKFRTMVPEAPDLRVDIAAFNENDGPVFKMRQDPRITRIGGLLRRFSLDELPQLFHVLSGKMSLVGPRPPLPEEVESYNEWEQQRLLVKPGLTCIWQVSGRSDLDFITWISMDIKYIREWSVWVDIKLLARTLGAVLTGRGAY